MDTLPKSYLEQMETPDCLQMQYYLIKSYSVDYSVAGTMSINAMTMYDYYPPI